MGKTGSLPPGDKLEKIPKYSLAESVFSDKRATMQNDTIYWSATDTRESLTDACLNQAIRMITAGFSIDVSPQEDGLHFVSFALGEFHIPNSTTHGVLTLSKSDVLASLLIIGAQIHSSTDMLVAGSDGKPLTPKEKHLFVKALIAHLPEECRKRIIIACGLFSVGKYSEFHLAPQSNAAGNCRVTF